MTADNVAYLDEDTKRMIRRTSPTAPTNRGCKVPFASRKIPIPYGWGADGCVASSSASCRACLRPNGGRDRLHTGQGHMMGRVFAAVGPSGAGKDRLLAGAVAADARLHGAVV